MCSNPLSDSVKTCPDPFPTCERQYASRYTVGLATCMVLCTSNTGRIYTNMCFCCIMHCEIDKAVEFLLDYQGLAISVWIERLHSSAVEIEQLQKYKLFSEMCIWLKRTQYLRSLLWWTPEAGWHEMSWNLLCYMHLKSYCMLSIIPHWNETLGVCHFDII
jgi:hypothetical protein